MKSYMVVATFKEGITQEKIKAQVNFLGYEAPIYLLKKLERESK